MRHYRLLEAMTFRSGRFKLTQEQFRRRQHVTRLIDKDERIVEPNPDISFKRDEIIETDIEVPRALESKLRPWTPEEPANDSEPPLLPTAESIAPAGGASELTGTGAGLTLPPAAPVPVVPVSGADGAAAVVSSEQTDLADDPLADIDLGGGAPAGDAGGDATATGASGEGEQVGANSAPNTDSAPAAEQKAGTRSRRK